MTEPTEPTDPPEDPGIAPDGEVPGMRRVLQTAQSGSPLDLRAREVLARLSMDENQDESVRVRAREALAGKATLRDVAAVPAFAQRMEAAGRALQAAMAEMTDEQREAFRTSFLTGKPMQTPPDGSGGTGGASGAR